MLLQFLGKLGLGGEVSSKAVKDKHLYFTSPNPLLKINSSIMSLYFVISLTMILNILSKLINIVITFKCVTHQKDH